MNWLRELKYQCVVAASSTDSIIEVYSTERDQVTDFCKLVKAELEPLTLESSLTEMVDELKFNQFIAELYSNDEIVFSETPMALKICGFRQHRDKIYKSFLEYLPAEN